MAPTSISALVTRAMLLGAGLACAAVVVAVVGSLLAGQGQRLSRPGVLFLVVAPSAVAIALVHLAIWQGPRVARWPSAHAARWIACELALLAVSLIVVETLMAFWASDPPNRHLLRKQTAAKLGVRFDPRNASEVVADLRQRGVDALPAFARELPRFPLIRAQLPDGFYPLSHVSRVSVVECNEGGEFLVYRTDEFGFNNPPGLLASHKIGLAAVGESLTLGHCVPPADSLVARLRTLYPRTANFGIAGSATLSVLASFREYVEPLRPPVVLWIVNPFAAVDDEELKDPILVRYLDPAFSQHLRERQPEVNRVVRNTVMLAQTEAERAARLAVERAEESRFTGIPRLFQLRKRDYIAFRQAPSAPPDLRAFVQALSLARETTRQWGGDFVVLLLPTFSEIVAKRIPSTLRHEHLKQVLTEHEVPVIDAIPLFLDRHDPAALYSLRIDSHPTAEGHALLANYVAHELERRFPQRVAGLRFHRPGDPT
jgi:hypothetical protein